MEKSVLYSKSNFVIDHCLQLDRQKKPRNFSQNQINNSDPKVTFSLIQCRLTTIFFADIK